MELIFQDQVQEQKKQYNQPLLKVVIADVKNN